MKLSYSLSPTVPWYDRWEKVKGLDSCIALGALDTSYGLKQRQSQIRVCVRTALLRLGRQFCG